MNNRIQNISIQSNTNVLNALKQMDTFNCKLLIVFENEKFINILSIGDLQRAIIKNTPLDTSIKYILRNKIRIADEYDSIEHIKKQMLDYRMEFMPVINKNKVLLKIHFWDDFFISEDNKPKVNLSLPVVIMAGGKGTRLLPLTNILPKPLIPIGKKTIIEEIMDKFVDCGCKDIFISVNYKADFIKHYFKMLDNKSYNINFFQENKPLGTAGSLHLLKNRIKSTFFVTNCDIIINQEIPEILNYHYKNKNELTVVAAIKNYPIPYGTLSTGANGLLESLTEKPDLTFKINTGFYILEPHLINEIPENEFYHITTLIEKLINKKSKVGVFPVSEKSWIDVGEWNQYLEYIKK